MEIVHLDTIKSDDNPLPHRHGGIQLTYLLTGEENTPDNFAWTIGNESSSYYAPRHRHNFDQVRLCLSGSIPIGKNLMVDAGEVGYFPEGVHYGPQEGGPDRLTLVLQAGGASGQGYMSARQLKAGYEALLSEGTFEKGVFHRTSGEGKKNQDSYDAIWQKVFGRPLDYPKPRYKAPIVIQPENFAWAQAEAAGVCRKALGVFGERGVGLDFYAITPGTDCASIPSKGSSSRRPLFAALGRAARAGRVDHVRGRGRHRAFRDHAAGARQGPKRVAVACRGIGGEAPQPAVLTGFSYCIKERDEGTMPHRERGIRTASGGAADLNPRSKLHDSPRMS